MRRTSRNTPLEIYHGVPAGWRKPDVIAAYKSLGGNGLIDLPEVTEPGAPNWLPDRYNWLQYRATIKQLAALARTGDLAAIELAIRYIVLNYFGSYSGYLRASLARALKHPHLTKQQETTLTGHFSELVSNKQCMQEFKEYSSLSNHINRVENA